MYKYSSLVNSCLMCITLDCHHRDIAIQQYVGQWNTVACHNTDVALLCRMLGHEIRQLVTIQRFWYRVVGQTLFTTMRMLCTDQMVVTGLWNPPACHYTNIAAHKVISRTMQYTAARHSTDACTYHDAPLSLHLQQTYKPCLVLNLLWMQNCLQNCLLKT